MPASSCGARLSPYALGHEPLLFCPQLTSDLIDGLKLFLQNSDEPGITPLHLRFQIMTNISVAQKRPGFRFKDTSLCAQKPASFPCKWVSSPTQLSSRQSEEEDVLRVEQIMNPQAARGLTPGTYSLHIIFLQINCFRQYTLYLPHFFRDHIRCPHFC